MLCCPFRKRRNRGPIPHDIYRQSPTAILHRTGNAAMTEPVAANIGGTHARFAPAAFAKRA